MKVIVIISVLVLLDIVLSYRVPSLLSLKRTSSSSYNKLYSSEFDRDDLWYEKVQYVDLNAQVEPSPTARPLPLFLLGISILCY